MVTARRANASRIIATADRSPLTASSAATWATLATFDVLCDWKLIAAFITSAGPDHPADAPAGHRVRLGDAVDDDALVGELGHDRRHGDEPVVAVDEVLVDLVGQDPHALVDRPAADGLDLLRRVDRRRSGCRG